MCVVDLNATIQLDAEQQALTIERSIKTLVSQLKPEMFTAPITQEALLGYIEARNYTSFVQRRRIFDALDDGVKHHGAPAATIDAIKTNIRLLISQLTVVAIATSTLTGKKQPVH